MKLSGWGKYPVIESEPVTPAAISDLEVALPGFAGITRGMGRSYGDSSLAAQVVDTRRLNHFIDFDETLGIIRCAAGVSLAEILTVFVPRGWFLSVTPGTRFVSVGGAIASDVHGKNHHLEGSFSDHLLSFKLILANAETVDCSPQENPELFRATCGGMGLTGIILEATFRLRPIFSSRIHETICKTANLEELFELFEQHHNATYSVAWVDCLSTGKKLGRSLLMLGEHARQGVLELTQKNTLSVPFNMPNWLLNRYSISAFNTLYYNRIRSSSNERTIPFEPFFYPLDSLQDWNRIYGKNGFTQYQFVIPRAAGLEGMRKILNKIAASKKGSFLAVLKAFGQGNANYLSFPMAGYTLALDFKLEAGLFDLLEELDQIVLDYNGRIYLAKDVRMSEKTFKQSYPDWEKISLIRQQTGADKMFNSLQSERLGL